MSGAQPRLPPRDHEVVAPRPLGGLGLSTTWVLELQSGCSLCPSSCWSLTHCLHSLANQSETAVCPELALWAAATGTSCSLGSPQIGRAHV